MTGICHFCSEFLYQNEWIDRQFQTITITTTNAAAAAAAVVVAIRRRHPFITINVHEFVTPLVLAFQNSLANLVSLVNFVYLINISKDKHKCNVE